MTSIALRLNKRHVTTSMGAVATLHQVADESGAAMRQGQRLDVVIPANSGSSADSVQLDPGRWLVEATLPSGEVITEEVAVPRGQNVPVTLYAAEHSPHEWLGWQHLTGNIEGKETLQRLYREEAANLTARAKTLTRATRGLVDRFESLGRADIESASDAAPDVPTVHLYAQQDCLRGAAAWTNVLERHPPLAAQAHPPAWTDTGQQTTLYYLAGPEQRPERHCVCVEWLGESFAVSLPLPWQSLKDKQPVRVQIMVRVHPTQGNVQIGVIAEDPDFATMAGLMTASTLPKAAVAARQAQDMLFGKMKNPLAAAAGGYVLLAAGDLNDTKWHGWIDNLASFPDIPDGAVLQASLRLRYPKSANSEGEARAALLDAFDRGIPFYSAGVSWLLDGLTAFADDPAVEKKMRIVQRVAFRLDLSQAFTVIRTSDKVKR